MHNRRIIKTHEGQIMNYKIEIELKTITEELSLDKMNKILKHINNQLVEFGLIVEKSVFNEEYFVKGICLLK